MRWLQNGFGWVRLGLCRIRLGYMGVRAMVMFDGCGMGLLEHLLAGLSS